MEIFLTFDYELFFGEKSGSVDKCLIEPTNKLMELSKKHKVRFVFFWDIGFYLALEKFETAHPQLSIDKLKVKNQIKELISNGHDIQLHIHPHWEKAEFCDGKWQMNIEKHYKLSDFPSTEHSPIFKKYKNKLDEIIGKKSTAFRAGGWCIQPFSVFKPLFQENQIRFDSSVMPGVKWISAQYQLDFTDLSSSEPFRFSENECSTDPTGAFQEYPIHSRKYSPFFFWRLYVLGRLFPDKHKMWGDGRFLSQPGGKREMLTQGKIHHTSSDGYFASELKRSLKEKIQKNETTLVVIGHPKSMTQYSIQKLDAFLLWAKKEHVFKTFSDL